VRTPWRVAIAALVVTGASGAVATASVSRPSRHSCTIWDVSTEERTPAEVHAVVRCRVALALVDGRVQPAPTVCTE
jgi:hypothetical protein